LLKHLDDPGIYMFTCRERITVQCEPLPDNLDWWIRFKGSTKLFDIVLANTMGVQPAAEQVKVTPAELLTTSPTSALQQTESQARDNQAGHQQPGGRVREHLLEAISPVPHRLLVVDIGPYAQGNADAEYRDGQ
jgi:hypothetical protein